MQSSLGILKVLKTLEMIIQAKTDNHLINWEDYLEIETEIE